MKQVLPLAVVLVIGVAIGYLLPRQGELDAPDQVSTGASSVAEDKGTSEAPMKADAASTAATLEGRAPETPATPARPSPPRVTQDGRVRVNLHVEMPDGSAPTTAMVYWTTVSHSALNDMRRSRWSASRRSVYLRPGSTWFLATGGTREGLKSKQLAVDVSAKGPTQDVRLVLEERAGIHGKVVLPGDFDRPRLQVKLLRYVGDHPPEKPVFPPSLQSKRPRGGDGYGYAFHDLKPGKYLVALAIGRREAVVMETVEVQATMVEQDLVVEAFDPKHFMNVSVLGPHGKPVRDAQISIAYSGKRASVAGGNVSLLRKDGGYIIDHAPAFTLGEDGKYKAGIYSIRVRTRTHGEIIKPYDPSSTTDMVVRVGELQALVVQLDDSAGGTRPAHLKVGARAVGETGVSNPQELRPDGSVHFGERSPGDYEVVVMTSKPRFAIVAVHPIKFEPGDEVKVVPAPVFHRLVLRLPKNAEDPQFRLSRKFGKEQWSYGWAKSGAKDEMVFLNLTAGTYSLEGHVGKRWVSRDVQVSGETEVRLD